MKLKTTMLMISFSARAVLTGSILYWLHRMRAAPCACASSWKRDFLYWSLPVDLVARLVLYSSMDSLQRLPWGVYASARFAIAAFDIFQLAVLWSYARDLQREACECSAAWQRELALAWPVFYLGYAAGVLHLAMAFAVTWGIKKKRTT